MQIGGVKPGDIVKCERQGWVFFAEVTATGKGALEVEPINKGCTYREVKSRQVVAHYRKSKASS